MEIIQTTKMSLEESEKAALQTIKDAYIQCVTNDCFECDECPLYVALDVDGCIGMFADHVLAKLEGGNHDN